MPATLKHIQTNFARIQGTSAQDVLDQAVADSTANGKVSESAAWKLFVERMVEANRGVEIPGTVGAAYRPRRARKSSAKPVAVPLDQLAFADLKALAVKSGLKSNGSKQAITDRLVAAGVPSAPQSK